MQESEVAREMPRYRCHKEVWALKIRDLLPVKHAPCIHPIGSTTCGYGPYENLHVGSSKPKPPNGRHKYEPADGLDKSAVALMIVPDDDGYAPFPVDADYIDRHKPAVGGYYVVYKDGYKSFSPAEAFEQGYTLL